MTLTNTLGSALRRRVALIALTITAAAPALAGHHEKDTMASANIVATADQAGQFTTLLAAAKAAGLADVLANDGPFTVFAPTDAAFGALPAGTIEELLKPANRDALARILKFHVLSGKVGSDALADGIQVATLAGADAAIAASEGGFTIEGAQIVATDIAASNGVIHVIDRVILPPETMSSLAAPSTPAAQLIEAAIDRGVPLFNHGNAAATAGIYMLTAQSLLQFADAAELSPAARERLAEGVRAAGMQRDARQQAWTLRYALDDVRDAIDHGRMQAANR